MIYLFLKNIIGKVLLPTPILGILVLLGILIIKAKPKLVKTHYIFLSVFFFIIGCDPIIDFTLDKYENIHPKFDTSKHISGINYIVVLGGGIDLTPLQPLSSQLSVPSSIRLMEGIRLHRRYPGSKLILSGRGSYKELTEAAAMAELANELGVEKSLIIQDPISKNTFEHTQNLKGILKEEKFILVTSAMHMNRSMLIFKNQGMKPIPAPTQFILKGQYKGLLSNIRILPSGDNFYVFDQVSYEMLSLMYAKIKGYF